MDEQRMPAEMGASAHWVAVVTMATVHPIPEEALVRMDAVAEKLFDAGVTARAGAPGLVFTAEVRGKEVGLAPEWAAQVAEEVGGYGVASPAWVVELHVRTPEQYEADALRPDIPPLAGASDAAELLGVSRQRVHQLASSHPSFPAPVARVGAGPLWTVSALEAFSASWDRRPGRPRSSVREAG